MQNKTIEGYRLSPQQKQVWEMQQAGGCRAHHARCAVLAEGQLNIALLKAAVENVVERHEILRTTFQCLPGMDAPLQVVHESGGLAFREYDLSGADSSQREARLEGLFRQLGQVTFDPEVPPALQASIVTLSPYRHALLLALPALCADRRTLDNLAGEISRSYAACLRGEAVEDEAAQYPDVSEILNVLLESGDTRAGRDYWRKQDVRQLLALHLPFVGEAEGLNGFDPQSVSFAVEPETCARLSKVARSHEASDADFALACWQTLLWRLTGQSDLVVGVGFDGRTDEDLAGALGLFARRLPVRCRLSEGSPFAEVLGEARRATSEVVKWQEYFTWEDVASAAAGDDTGPSFFPACFDFTERSAPHADSNVTFTVENHYVFCAERFNVKLCCIRERDGLRVEVHYDASLFEADTVKRLGRQFQTLLESAAADPQTSVGGLVVVGVSEREQVLVEFNRTDVAHGENNRLHVLFEEQAARTPGQVAVVSGEQSLTYARLNARANRLAYRLREMGVGREVLVGVCVERSPEMLVGLLAVLKAGGAYVPLDPKYPRERLAYMLEDARTRVLLTQAHLKEGLPAHAAQVVCLGEGGEGDGDGVDAENPESGVTSDNAAYVVYTSGSTGRPKGVVVTHGAICNHMLWMQSAYPTTAADRILQRAPFSFDASVWELFAPLMTGAQLILARPEDHQDMSRLVQTMVTHEVTTLQLVPSMLRVLLDEPQLDACSSLRRVFCGGERLPVELQGHFFTRLTADLNNLYGPTEAAINATSWACRRDWSERAVPIGHPVDNTQIYLLDSHLMPVPIGVPGALHIGGAGLARGYLNRAELTAERFIPDPFSARAGARLYHTGDLARFRPDGAIEFLGRGDEQVKIRGFRIELGEIEALLATYPAVNASVVIAREDAPGDRRLVAYLVLNQGWTATTSELRRFLNENLPEYMIPSAFVLLDGLPSMPNGKVDRRALPAPEHHRPELEKTFVAPLTPVERQLAQVWSKVLGIEQVGVHDNFFDLGGDSILAIRVAAKVNQSGLQVTPRQLFQNQTIAELSAVVGLAGAREEAEAPTGPVPLTPIQSRFFKLNQPDEHHFNQSVLLEVRQALDADLLRRAVGELMRRHHALSLRFREEEGVRRQTSAEPDGEAPFVRVDLTAWLEGQEAEQLAALESIANELQASLNLSDGPLVRVALFDFGANRTGRLLIVIHHLAVDIVSWGILLEDLQTAYQQLSRREAVRLAPRTTSFKQWAERLNAYAQSAELRRELDYWLAAPRQKVASLPVDYHEGANTVEAAGTVSVSLDVEDTLALLREVPKAYHTQIHEVLLTALVLACARWTGQSSMLVDLEGHGREEIFDDVDLSRTVGWFTAVFPLLLDLEGVDGPEEALKAVKEQVRQTPHGGLGYGVLRYMSGDGEVADSLAALPQAGVIFNHMGQFDHVIDESAPFVPARESSGRTHSPRRTRDHLLEINGGVSDGRLQIFWTFCENVHRRTTVENVALLFIEELKALIVHCLSPSAGAYTPSDFPEAGLDDEKLNRILETVRFGE